MKRAIWRAALYVAFGLAVLMIGARLAMPPSGREPEFGVPALVAAIAAAGLACSASSSSSAPTGREVSRRG